MIKSLKANKQSLWGLTYPLIAFSSVTCFLLIVRIIISGSYKYWFLPWNLLLAWVPLVASIFLCNLLARLKWTSWQAVVTSLIWLFFLPNTFYLMTDFVHLRHTSEANILFDVVILGMFSFAGFLLGFLSLLLVHRQLDKRFKPSLSNNLVLFVILLSSFAIYLGRYLRWNSWDVVTNPFGIAYDVVDRLASPTDFPTTFVTTAMFFVITTSFYFCTLWLIRLIKELPKP